MPECKVCHRLHEVNQPCPRRVANAYTMQPKALEEITEPDKAWMWAHPSFSVLDTVEDVVVKMMQSEK